jgi:phytanoyl-CoA hydroxylase
VYFPFGPANRIAAGWAALEDASRDNGCLVVYPGTHKGKRYYYNIVGLVEHCYPDWKEGVNKAYWGIKEMPPDSAPRVHLEMKAGDIVFFHPFLYHGSGENKVLFNLI